MHKHTNATVRLHSTLGVRLADAGVDFYAILQRDLWHPKQYIPLEVDPCAWHPAALFGPPPPGFMHQLLQALPVDSIGSPSGLVVGQLGPAELETLKTPNPAAAAFHPIGQYHLGSVFAREAITDCLIVATVAHGAPAHWSAETPFDTVIAFASRDPSGLATSRADLLELANDVVTHVTPHGSDNELRPLRRHTRLTSELLSELADYRASARTPASPQRDADIANMAVQVLEGHFREVSVGIALLTSVSEGTPADGLYLQWVSPSRDNSPLGIKYPCKDRGTIGILTTLSGRAHYVPYLSSQSHQPHHTNVLIPYPAANELQGLRHTWPTWMTVIRTGVKTHAEQDHWYWRCMHPAPQSGVAGRTYWENCVRGIAEQLSTPLFRWIGEVMVERSKHDFSHLYAVPSHSTQSIGCELCVPILAGGIPIGCLNLEHKKPHGIASQLVSTATAAARIIGMSLRPSAGEAVSQQTIAALRRLHTPSPVRFERDRLDAFLEEVRTALLADEARIIVERERGDPSKGLDELARAGRTRIAATDSQSDSFALTQSLWTSSPDESGWIIEFPDRNLGAKRVIAQNGEISQGGRVAVPEDLATSDIRLLVGIKLRSQGLRQSAAGGILWVGYRFAGRFYAEGNRWTDTFHGQIAQLRDVASTLEAITGVVQELEAARIRRTLAINHDGYAIAIDSAQAELDRMGLPDCLLGDLLQYARAMTEVDHMQTDHRRSGAVLPPAGNATNLRKHLELVWRVLDNAIMRDSVQSWQFDVRAISEEIHVGIDESALIVLLSNVLRNCRKHGHSVGQDPPGGQVVCTAEVVPREGREAVKLRIRDFGRGFNPSRDPYVNQFNSRVGITNPPEEKGRICEGLALVQQVCRRYAGYLPEIESRIPSEVGGGAAAILYLPYRAV